MFISSVRTLPAIVEIYNNTDAATPPWGACPISCTRGWYNRSVRKRILSFVLGVVVTGGIFGYGTYQLYIIETTDTTQKDLNDALEYQISVLSDKLTASNATNDDLKTLLQARQQENEAMGSQVQTLSGALGTLDKLVKTDKQLLEKYSSVYFLNENYTPQNLLNINTAYLSRPDKGEQVIAGVLPHLTALLQAAAANNIPLQVLSGYRSFGTQASLKTGYKVVFGSGTANAFSADQGYSEHQLGTTVDFTTPAVGAALTGFDKLPTNKWLLDHAYLYGFNLSYPKGNKHFVYEPWHWRYVGVELAKKLHDENKSLNDLDQRDIDTYLIKFLD